MAEINDNISGPDRLLVNIGKSIMFKAMVISIIAHVVFTGITSIGLFKDWCTYGVKSPSAINAIRTQERKDAEAKQRKAEAEAKAKEAEAKREEEKKAAATNQVNKAAANKGGDAPTAGKGDAKTPPEVQPLPPKKEFQLGDDLSLD